MRRSRPDAVRRTVTVASRLEALEAENRDLRARLNELTSTASRNESLFRKTQERELELIRAGGLAQLLERIVHGLSASYLLDAVALVLHDPDHEIRHLLAGDGFLFESMREVQFVDELVTMTASLRSLERPLLGLYRTKDHQMLVPHAGKLGSVALIPLRRGEQLDGVLVLGSNDRLRFTPELGSDFLAHLGLVAAICIENAVNRARLLRSGLTDFLTGFHNRRYLHARLCEELARAQRGQQSVACLMIDVDHFKRINDQYGHLAGDAVLREVARRIEAHMRMSDTGARFGGDEFAIVLPQGDVEDGRKVAERVLDGVRGTPIAVNPETRETVTLSIGVAAAVPPQGLRDYQAVAEQLMADADAALYRAKRAGRNGIAT